MSFLIVRMSTQETTVWKGFLKEKSGQRRLIYYLSTFQSLTTLRPRVIICEHNPTFPPYIDVYPAVENNYVGCSARALARLGQTKGCTPIAMTITNSIFVRNDYLHLFINNFEINLYEMFNYIYVMTISTDYAGHEIFFGPQDKPPHGVREKAPYGLCGRYQGQLQGSDASRIVPLQSMLTTTNKKLPKKRASGGTKSKTKSKTKKKTRTTTRRLNTTNRRKKQMKKNTRRHHARTLKKKIKSFRAQRRKKRA
jgi:hypothetical protein